jgi:hypothetical protein
MPSTDESFKETDTVIVTIPDFLWRRHTPVGPTYPLDDDTAGSPYDLPPTAIPVPVQRHEPVDCTATDEFDYIELDEEDVDRFSEEHDYVPFTTGIKLLDDFGDWYESLPPVYSWGILSSMISACFVLFTIIVWLLFFAPAHF